METTSGHDESLATIIFRFQSEIDDKLKKIQASVADSLPVAETDPVIHTIRKIASTCAAFGFTEYTAHFLELEEIAVGIKPRSLLDDVFKRLSSISRAAIPPAMITHIVPSYPTVSLAKLIYLYDHDNLVAEDLSQQLGYFGYDVKNFDAFQHLFSRLGDGEPVLLIVDTHVLNNDEAVELLHDYRARRNSVMRIIFVSVRDDFDIRLRSIRAGGDAFFQIPVDISRLIDKIDSLSGQSEASPYHVLLVEDESCQTDYYRHILENGGFRVTVSRDPRDVMKALVESKPELILMDLNLQQCSGFELASLIRQQEAFVSIPIVFISAGQDLDRQLNAMKLGADDFLTKPIQPFQLITSLASRIERSRNMRFFMERDSLTGLLNHSNLLDHVQLECLRSRRSKTPFCFAMIDIDNFKLINDTYGHMTGDRVIKSIARMLQERLRKSDLVGRYGGEEFGIILLETRPEQAEIIMNEIRENFSRIRHKGEGEDFFVTFSCGIAGYEDFPDPAALNLHADMALYRSKNSGRNCVSVAQK